MNKKFMANRVLFKGTMVSFQMSVQKDSYFIKFKNINIYEV